MARTGPYAAAQLWKLDNIRGRHFDLFGHIMPYFGDPTLLVPEEWLRVFRTIHRFTPPLVLVMFQEARFDVFVEEVRGTGIPVSYRSRTHSEHDILRAIPRNGTRNGYYDIQLAAEPCIDFMDEWRARWGSCWPTVAVNGVPVLHPGLENLCNRAQVVAREWHRLGNWHRERLARRDRRALRGRPVHWAMEGRARDEMGRPLEDSD